MTDLPFERDEAEEVLDCGVVTAGETFEHAEGVFVASSTGAYRSRDGGDTWEDLGVPLGDRFWHAGESEVWSVLATADGALVVFFLGTTPAIHDFWTMEGKERQQNEINFLKSVALLGGAIILLSEATDERA